MPQARRQKKRATAGHVTVPHDSAIYLIYYARFYTGEVINPLYFKRLQTQQPSQATGGAAHALMLYVVTLCIAIIVKRVIKDY